MSLSKLLNLYEKGMEQINVLSLKKVSLTGFPSGHKSFKPHTDSFFYPIDQQMLFMVLLSYFLVTGGIIYDVIVEPPSMGSTTDERGHSRPVAFMQYRINGQGGD